MIWFLVVALNASSYAAIPAKNITTAIEEKLNSLSSKETWEEFVERNETLFPHTDKSEHRTHVKVEKETVQVNGSSYTLGVGYRQTFIKAPMEKVKRILNNPKLFKNLYGLDSEAQVGDLSVTGDDVLEFKARIFKKVPLIPDQDYVLHYKNSKSSSLWLQRAKLEKDNSDFALRDNLKTLEETKDGTIFREISIVYVLKWYVRFFGPSVREVMTKELAKITEAVKCLAEADAEVTESGAESCWKKANEFKLQGSYVAQAHQ